MPFYKGMIQKHIGDNSMIGAVARLMEAHKHMFRRARSYGKSRGYLEKLNPRQEYFDAFDQAWREYREYQMQDCDA